MQLQYLFTLKPSMKQGLHQRATMLAEALNQQSIHLPHVYTASHDPYHIQFSPAGWGNSQQTRANAQQDLDQIQRDLQQQVILKIKEQRHKSHHISNSLNNKTTRSTQPKQMKDSTFVTVEATQQHSIQQKRIKRRKSIEPEMPKSLANPKADSSISEEEHSLEQRAEQEARFWMLKAWAAQIKEMCLFGSSESLEVVRLTDREVPLGVKQLRWKPLEHRLRTFIANLIAGLSAMPPEVISLLLAKQT